MKYYKIASQEKIEEAEDGLKGEGETTSEPAAQPTTKDVTKPASPVENGLKSYFFLFVLLIMPYIYT